VKNGFLCGGGLSGEDSFYKGIRIIFFCWSVYEKLRVEIFLSELYEKSQNFFK